MIIPNPLKIGDKIALVAPCFPTTFECVHRAADFISELGYIPKIYPSCFQNTGYLAGSDISRAADINAAFADPDIAGIMAIRGGYGGARLAKYLNYDIIKAHSKMFCGFSDVTVLHIILNQRCSLATFHTPMPSDAALSEDELSRSALAEMLRGNYPTELNNHSTLRAVLNGNCCGILAGGNLTVIASTVGTPYEIDPRGKILFLEDVNEPAYAIDRCLIQLRDSGILDGCRGIILGTWQGCKFPNDKCDELFREILKSLNIPVVSGLQCGHGLPSISLPLGFEVELYVYPNECRIIIKSKKERKRESES